MNKIILMVGLFFLSGSMIYAAHADENKVSTEFSTVRACYDTLHWKWLKDFTLENITQATSFDSGKSITITLDLVSYIDNGSGEFKAAKCSVSHWYKYDGTETQCDECQNQPENADCVCSNASCETEDHQRVTKTTQMKYAP
jgi:hypothetical protein